MNRSLAYLLMVVGLALVGCADAVTEETTTTAGGDGATTPTVGEGATTTGAGGGEEGRVVMQDISFQPDQLTVSVGTTVTWTNEDGVSHTTTSEDDVWDSGTLSGGESFTFTFDEPGTYPYICEIHPNQMQATITVEG